MENKENNIILNVLYKFYQLISGGNNEYLEGLYLYEKTLDSFIILFILLLIVFMIIFLYQIYYYKKFNKNKFERASKYATAFLLFIIILIFPLRILDIYNKFSFLDVYINLIILSYGIVVTFFKLNYENGNISRFSITLILFLISIVSMNFIFSNIKGNYESFIAEDTLLTNIGVLKSQNDSMSVIILANKDVLGLTSQEVAKLVNTESYKKGSLDILGEYSREIKDSIKNHIILAKRNKEEIVFLHTLSRKKLDSAFRKTDTLVFDPLLKFTKFIPQRIDTIKIGISDTVKMVAEDLSEEIANSNTTISEKIDSIKEENITYWNTKFEFLEGQYRTNVINAIRDKFNSESDSVLNKDKIDLILREF